MIVYFGTVAGLRRVNRYKDVLLEKMSRVGDEGRMHIYNDEIAKHYAAYRPPLHELILGEVLSGRRFESGLDIGCGTGRSSLALLQYCSGVTGLDNSEQMLRKAATDPGITYHLIENPTWPVEGNAFDVVTFAGVLPYLDEDQTIAELSRVCRSQAAIIPYDFEVQVDRLLRMLSIEPLPAESEYDHSRNLSRNPNALTSVSEARQVELAAEPEDAAHILMSDVTTYTSLTDAMGEPVLHEKVAAALRACPWDGKLYAKIYFASHTLR